MWIIFLTLSTWLATASSKIPCQEARLKCAYRVGCGMALQNYIVRCGGVLDGPFPDRCPEICQHSLIALVSTEEGMELMNCECSDDECLDKKARTDVCRPQVNLSMSQPVLTCRVAQWICSADALCSTALDYYNRFCRAMFVGKKCNARCHNSIKILRRQEKAAKLFTCKCDGREDYDCYAIQKNMNNLCFRKHSKHHHNQTRILDDDALPHTTSIIPIPEVEMDERQSDLSILNETSSSGRRSMVCAKLLVAIAFAVGLGR